MNYYYKYSTLIVTNCFISTEHLLSSLHWILQLISIKIAGNHWKRSIRYDSSLSFLIQGTLFVALLVLAASVRCDSQFHLPIDCDDIYRNDNTSSSGVYTIYPGGPTTPLHVYCDMDTDGGRWTVSTPHISSDFIVTNMNINQTVWRNMYLSLVFVSVVHLVIYFDLWGVTQVTSENKE